MTKAARQSGGSLKKLNSTIGTKDMTSETIGTWQQLRDPNYTPALSRAIPLGVQLVLALAPTRLISPRCYT